jgi:hypothetical protein
MSTIESRLAAVEQQLRWQRAVIAGLQVALIALMACAGCSADMVYTSDSLGDQAAGRGGAVEYLESSTSTLRWLTSRGEQDNAVRQMRAYCAPQGYRVTHVDRRTQYRMPWVHSGNSSPEPITEVFATVHFRCEAAPAKESQPGTQVAYTTKGRCGLLNLVIEFQPCLVAMGTGQGLTAAAQGKPYQCIDRTEPWPFERDKVYATVLVVPEQFADWNLPQDTILLHTTKLVMVRLDNDLISNGAFDESKLPKSGTGTARALFGQDVCGMHFPWEIELAQSAP